MKVGPVAAVTNIALASATIVTTLAVVNTTNTVAMLALGAVAAVFAGLTIAAATAYFDARSTTVDKYFEQLQTHAGFIIVGMFQMAAQAIFQALVQGAADNVRDRVSGRQGYNVSVS